MDFNKLLNNNGTVNPKLATKHSQAILASSSLLDNRFPTLGTRIKWLIFKPTTDKCACGNYLKFSPNKGEVYKKTCGSSSCSAISFDRKKSLKKFKKTLDLHRARMVRSYSIAEQKQYVTERMQHQLKANYYLSKNDDIALFMKREAKTKHMKITQYCYHLMILNNMEQPRCCNGTFRSFRNFKEGYNNHCIHCYQTAAFTARINNSIAKKTSDFNTREDLEVLQSNPINEKSWIIRCRIV